MLLSTLSKATAVKKMKTNEKKKVNKAPTVTIKLEPIKFIGGGKLMKELQWTVSGKIMSEKQQKEFLRTAVHGNGDPGHIALTEQMAMGLNQFGALYEEVDICVNDDQNSTSASSQAYDRTSFDKKLKDCFYAKKAQVENLICLPTRKMA